MEFTLSDQMRCLVSAFLCGLLLGFVYDVFRFLRFVFSGGKTATFIFDILFMLCFSFTSLFFSMAYSFGKARYFTLFAQVLGILCVRFTYGLLSMRLLAPACAKTRLFFEKIQIKSKKLAKKLLQPKYKMLYNKVKKRDIAKDDNIQK